MQNSQFIADRIKQQIKEQNKSVKGTLSDLHMGINTISALSKGKEISYVKMSEFAEYLNCSVDYLLGRTDNPQSHTGTGEISQDANKLLACFSALNDEGKEKAIERLEEMAALDKYKKGYQPYVAKEA